MEKIDDMSMTPPKLEVTKTIESKLRSTALFGILSAVFGFFISCFILFQGAKSLATIYDLEATMTSNPIFAQSQSNDIFTSAKIYGYSFILVGLVVLTIVVLTLIFSIQIRNGINHSKQLTFEKSIGSLRTIFLLNVINCFVVTLAILFTFFLMANGPRF